MKKNPLERAVKAIMGAGKLPQHKRPEPTKAQMEEKFVMRIDKMESQ